MFQWKPHCFKTKPECRDSVVQQNVRQPHTPHVTKILTTSIELCSTQCTYWLSINGFNFATRTCGFLPIELSHLEHFKAEQQRQESCVCKLVNRIYGAASARAQGQRRSSSFPRSLPNSLAGVHVRAIVSETLRDPYLDSRFDVRDVFICYYLCDYNI